MAASAPPAGAQWLHHNWVVDALGRCDCGCHRGRFDDCWCKAQAPSPHQISHHDAVALFGRCGCGCHTGRGLGCVCRAPSDSTWAHAVADHERRDRERRIRTGRMRSSDITWLAKRGRLR